MARFKNHLLVVVGFAIAGMIGAAFGTGTAQAVVSTLVSVVNPGTSPVQTNSVNVTDPGRVAYQSASTKPLACNGEVICPFSFGPVPSGHRLVVQHISAFAGFTGPGTPTATGEVSNNALEILSVFPIPTTNNGAAFGTEFDQPVQLYFDSSDSVSVALIVGGSGETFERTAGVTLTGYELDCTAAACAPIATQ